MNDTTWAVLDLIVRAAGVAVLLAGAYLALDRVITALERRDQDIEVEPHLDALRRIMGDGQ